MTCYHLPLPLPYSVSEEQHLMVPHTQFYPSACHFRGSSEEVGWKGIKWIYLDQHRDKWWARVDAVMNVRVQ